MKHSKIFYSRVPTDRKNSWIYKIPVKTFFWKITRFSVIYLGQSEQYQENIKQTLIQINSQKL